MPAIVKKPAWGSFSCCLRTRLLKKEIQITGFRFGCRNVQSDNNMFTQILIRIPNYAVSYILQDRSLERNKPLLLICQNKRSRFAETVALVLLLHFENTMQMFNHVCWNWVYFILYFIQYNILAGVIIFYSYILCLWLAVKLKYFLSKAATFGFLFLWIH